MSGRKASVQSGEPFVCGLLDVGARPEELSDDVFVPCARCGKLAGVRVSRRGMSSTCHSTGNVEGSPPRIVSYVDFGLLIKEISNNLQGSRRRCPMERRPTVLSGTNCRKFGSDTMIYYSRYPEH